MQIAFEIPEDIAAYAIPDGQDPARSALEALAIEGYRAQRLNESQVRRMLGYETRMQVHALLKQYDVYLNVSPNFVEEELAAVRLYNQQRLQK